MKKKQKGATKNLRNRHFLSRWKIYSVIGLGVAAAIAFGAVKSINSIYADRMSRSLSRPVKGDEVVYIGSQFRRVTLSDKVYYLYHNLLIERNYDSHIENFLSYLDKKENRKSIEDLVSVEYEKCGIIIAGTQGYEIKFLEPELRTRVLQYAKELRKRDFTHAREAASFVYAVLRGIKDLEMANMMVKFLHFAPEIETKIRAGELSLKDDLVTQYFKILGMTADALEFYSKACPRDMEPPANPRTMAAFHTHFFDSNLNPNPPTDGDISNTVMLGPSIVFSFPTKEKLSVYTIKYGNSTLAKEYTLEKRTNQ